MSDSNSEAFASSAALAVSTRDNDINLPREVAETAESSLGSKTSEGKLRHEFKISSRAEASAATTKAGAVRAVKDFVRSLLTVLKEIHEEDDIGV